MKSLPAPGIYEKEFKFMPWGDLIREIAEWIIKNAPPHSTVLDLMCGPGYLLGLLARARKDLFLTGLDIDGRYIDFARHKYKSVRFILADILNWQPDRMYNLVLCTGGFHHIHFDKQHLLLELITQCLEEKGVCILADPFIDPYTNELERRLAATQLGYEYLKAVIRREAPNDIVASAILILYGDILLDGEYKTFLGNFLKMARLLFSEIETHKTWPDVDSDYGDHYLILRK